MTVEHSGAVWMRGRRRADCRQAAGPYYTETERRRGPGLHRELLWPLSLPAGTAAQGRAGALHRGPSGVPFVVCLRRAQSRSRPPPPKRNIWPSRRELQADRNRAYDAKNRELHRSVVLRLTEQIQQLHPRPPAAQRPDRPQRQSGPGAGLAGSSAGRQPGSSAVPRRRTSPRSP